MAIPTKKLLTISLCAVLLVTSLALAPATSPSIPVLSSLEPEQASAHEARKTLFHRPTRVCSWEWQHVRVVTHYVDEFGNGPYPGPGSTWGPPLFPVYAWKLELVEVCAWILVPVTVPNPHVHVSQESCEWGVRAGGVVIALYGSAAAAIRALAAYAAGTQGTDYDIIRQCETEDIILWAFSDGLG